jgi:hypothetical protein
LSPVGLAEPEKTPATKIRFGRSVAGATYRGSGFLKYQSQ